MLENTAKEWFDIAYDQWLYSCDCSSNLREPTHEIVKQMYQAVDKRDYASAELLMRRLQILSNRFTQDQTGSSKEHFYEMAETLLECGRATYLMGEKLTAVQLLDESAKKYIGNDHCRAAVLWMLGCIQWQFPTKLDDAIVSWESSFEIYNNLQNRSNRSEVEKWYEYWKNEMRFALDAAISGQNKAPPAQTDWPLWSDTTSKSRSSNTQKTTSSNKSSGNAYLHKAVLRSFAVYASIPAGGFASSPQPRTHMEIEQVCIDGIDHFVRNLYQGQTINLLDIERYVVIQVTGDSMNRSGIEDGDYVLLRVQDHAENGDIVAFEINADLDEGESTLKQFFKSDGKITLKPQSNNPKHQTFEFTEHTLDFHIRGVAIAVLKKVP